MDDDSGSGRSTSGPPGGRTERQAAAERANRRICALFDACRGAETPRGTRDAALLSVLYGARVPRRTALSLRREAYDPASGRLEIPGGDPPVRWASEGARRALGDWSRLRGNRPGPLFRPLADGRPDSGRRLEPVDVTSLLHRWARAAGVAAFRPRAVRDLYSSPWWSSSPPG